MLCITNYIINTYFAHLNNIQNPEEFGAAMLTLVRSKLERAKGGNSPRQAMSMGQQAKSHVQVNQIFACAASLQLLLCICVCPQKHELVDTLRVSYPFLDYFPL